MAVEKTELPKDSRLHGFFKKGDFLDCYSVQLGRENLPIDQIAQHIFIGLPAWIDTLLFLRDAAVGPFGLKKTADLPRDTEMREQVKAGEAINFFPVQSVADNEIILGEDDRHLDFRIAVYRDREKPGRISLATLVHTHNCLGRTYLRLISSFHVLIVSARLAALARKFA